ncbi:nucleoside-diphosphate kinase [uncultured Traorella sp.]|uniref:nucleoside-diphosphate kinase n=1 Tax=uncultured Traorella sp. TaxID=1929048 RepID=UPI0025EBE955|nr:nucleoside-diphosphate kinase [uncultured Traorella sp.]
MKYKTLMILKPECYEWHIADDIQTMLKDHGYHIDSQKEVIIDMKVMQVFLMHYKEAIDKLGADFNFVGKLFNSYYFHGPHKINVMCISSDSELIEDTRKLIGATNPQKAEPDTIRALFSKDSMELAEKENRLIKNCIHASDSRQNANKELELWKDYL